MAKEYKVVKYKENFIKAILFGQAKISPRKLTKFLNRHSADGWSALTINKSVDSVFFLFSRENYVIVFEKEKSSKSIQTTMPTSQVETKPVEASAPHKEPTPTNLTESEL